MPKYYPGSQAAALFRPLLRDGIFDGLELLEQLFSPVRRGLFVLLLLPTGLFRLFSGGTGSVRARLSLPRARRSGIPLSQLLQDRPETRTMVCMVCIYFLFSLVVVAMLFQYDMISHLLTGFADIDDLSVSLICLLLS